DVQPDSLRILLVESVEHVLEVLKRPWREPIPCRGLDVQPMKLGQPVAPYAHHVHVGALRQPDVASPLLVEPRADLLLAAPCERKPEKVTRLEVHEAVAASPRAPPPQHAQPS